VPSFYVIWRPPNKAIKRIRQAYLSAKRDWQLLADDWNQSPRVTPFSSAMSALVALKREYDDLPNEHARRAAKLRDGRRSSQLTEHLDKFQLADAKIPGIGKAKVATLQSYQIFTASDVDPKQFGDLKISGFGPKNKDKILLWRQECERSFRYDPNRGVSLAATTSLQADITRRRSEIVRDLRNGLVQLRTIAADTTSRRKYLESRASDILPAIVQGRADAAAVGIAL
jgi:DNA-binding helix-hairpin-helix protein with protein kinase domain